MDLVISIAKWLFLESIYGIALIASAMYFIASGIKKVIPKAPHPIAIAALAFIVALFTLPSLPRYEFERESLAQIEGKEWIRIVKTTKWGSFTEPVTWLRAPIGSISMVMPNTPMEGGYREVLLRYNERPRIKMADPDCSQKTIFYSEPDGQGMVRYTSSTAQVMNAQEVSIYCDYDWSKEKEALRAESLKHVSAR